MTLDTFGLILQEQLRQLSLFGSSGKMSPDTLPLDSPQFTEAYEIWVIGLRRDYSARQKSGPRIEEQGSLSWRSPSNDGVGGARSRENIQADPHPKVKLRDQVNWPTPDTVPDAPNLGSNKKNVPKSFAEAVNWPTPQERDCTRDRSVKSDRLPDIVRDGLPDQDSPSMGGKSQGLWATPRSDSSAGSKNVDYQPGKKPRINGRAITTTLNDQIDRTKGKLNPDWVEQLMGLPVGWTDCDFSATESCPSRQKGHLGA